MPDTVNPGVLDALTVEEVKTTGTLPSNFSNIQFADAILQQRLGAADARLQQSLGALASLSHAMRSQIIAEAQLLNGVKGVGEDVNRNPGEEARADVLSVSGDAVAQQQQALNSNLTQLMASLNKIVEGQASVSTLLTAIAQQLIKGAQSTPPETATPAR